MDKLIVDDLHLSYGANPILNGVSFELKAGEVVCLLGASGSGKTTLLRAVAGLEQPSGGRIQLDGRVFFDGAQRIDLPVEQRSLGLVFQSYALWPHRTVADNVGYGLKLRQRGCRTEAPRAGRARPARPRSSGRTLPASTVGRPAAARRDRARARLQPAGDPARRAAVEPRREAARGGRGCAS
jgi:ABC-type sugar transport system ATPase subunit